LGTTTARILGIFNSHETFLLNAKKGKSHSITNGKTFVWDESSIVLSYSESNSVVSFQ